MPSPAERAAAVAPIIRRYGMACPKIATAKNVTQALDTVVRQKIYESGGTLSYRDALIAVCKADPELARAYADD